MEALEPAGAFFEWCDGGDERLYLNFSGRHPFDSLWIFSGRSAGALQANLPRDDFLQRQIHVLLNIPNENHSSAFADCVNRSGDGFVTTDTLDGDIHAFVAGAIENFLQQRIIGQKSFSSAEFGGESEALGVNIGNENFAATGGFEGLQRENADGAGSNDESGGVWRELREIDAVNCYGDCFEHCGLGEGKIVRQAIEDSRGDGDKFGEGSCAAIVAAGDAENLATVAEIDVAAMAVGTFTAVDSGIECDAIAGRKIFYGAANGGNNSGCFVAHDDGRDAAAGRAVVSMNIAATDAAGCNADEDFVGRGRGRREIRQLEIVVAGQE